MFSVLNRGFHHKPDIVSNFLSLFVLMIQNNHYQFKPVIKTCSSKLHAIILWPVISVKLNIVKKITGLEIYNCIESQKNLGCFQAYRTDV